MLTPATVQDLEQAILDQGTAVTFVGLVMMTDPLRSGMRRTGNPFVVGKGESAVSTIRKVTKVCGRINADYDADVRRRVGKAINLERQHDNLPPLPADELEATIDQRFLDGASWHKPLLVGGHMTPLSFNPNSTSGDRYLRLIVQSSGIPEFLDVQGNTVPTSDVKPFLPPEKTYDNQGLAPEDQVKFICPLVTSIHTMMMTGKRFMRCDLFPGPVTKRITDIAQEYLDGLRVTYRV